MIKSRILISMFQVLTGIATTFNIPYPEFYTNILRYLAAFELDLFNAAPIGCIVNITFHEIFLARTIIPLVVIVLLKLVPVIGPKLKKKSGSAVDSKEATTATSASSVTTRTRSTDPPSSSALPPTQSTDSSGSS